MTVSAPEPGMYLSVQKIVPVSPQESQVIDESVYESPPDGDVSTQDVAYDDTALPEESTQGSPVTDEQPMYESPPDGAVSTEDVTYDDTALPEESPQGSPATDEQPMYESLPDGDVSTQDVVYDDTALPEQVYEDPEAMQQKDAV